MPARSLRLSQYGNRQWWIEVEGDAREGTFGSNIFTTHAVEHVEVIVTDAMPERSHDLRGPLRAMDGFSQALLEDLDDKLDEQARDYLTRIRRASVRMAQLIDTS